MPLRLALFSLVIAAVAAGQEAGPSPRELRYDRHGYSLPQGAVARLGIPPALTGFAWSIAWTPDGNRFVAADENGFTIFNSANGRCVESFSDPTRAGIAFAPLLRDGHTFVRMEGATGSLISTATGENILQFTLPSPVGDEGRKLYSLNLSSNHRFLAGIASAPSSAGVAWRYDLARNRYTRLINDRADLQSMRLSPDGKRVFATGGTQEPELTAREVATDKKLWTVELKGAGALRAISAEGNRLAVSGVNGVTVFDAASGRSLVTVTVGAATPQGLLGIDLSPDGRYLAVADSRQVRVWDVESGQVKHHLPHEARLAAFSPDGKSLLTASAWVQRWDVESGKPSYAPPLLVRPEGATFLIWSGDGRRLFASWPHAEIGGSERRRSELLTVWDVARTECVWRSSVDEPVVCAFLDHDGSELRCALEPNVFRSWNFREAGKPHVSFAGPLKLAQVARSFLPDGRLAVQHLGGSDATIRCYDREGRLDLSRTCFWRDEVGLRPQAQNIRSQSGIAFGPGGWRWDLVADRGMPPLEGSLTFRFINMLTTHSTCCVAGRTIDQSTIAGHVWESLTGRIIVNLPSEIPNLERARLSPDGRLLAVAGEHRVMVHDLSNEKATRQPPVGNATAFAFAPNETTLAVASPDGTILIFDVTPKTSPWQAEQEARLWKDLAAANSVVAWRAIWHLLDHPAHAANLLSRLLSAIDGPKDTADQIVRLDHSKYAVREAALLELAGRGESIEGDLLTAIKTPRSEEQRARLAELLRRITRTVPPIGETLRGLRCIWLLERIGSQQARALLQELAKGTTGSRVTLEAKASLARLEMAGK